MLRRVRRAGPQVAPLTLWLHTKPIMSCTPRGVCTQPVAGEPTCSEFSATGASLRSEQHCSQLNCLAQPPQAKIAAFLDGGELKARPQPARSALVHAPSRVSL